jgi:hypothetical protein
VQPPDKPAQSLDARVKAALIILALLTAVFGISSFNESSRRADLEEQLKQSKQLRNHLVAWAVQDRFPNIEVTLAKPTALLETDVVFRKLGEQVDPQCLVKVVQAEVGPLHGYYQELAMDEPFCAGSELSYEDLSKAKLRQSRAKST